MAEAKGLESWIGLGVETTWGTSVARTKFNEILGESLDLKHGYQQKPNLRGVSKSRFVKKKKSVEGGIELQGQFDGLELYFKHAFGSVATAGAGPYTHTFSLASALPIGLTIEVNRDATAIGGSSADVYSGCQIAKLTFKQSMEDALNLSVEVVGKDGTFAAPSTPSFVTTPVLIDWSTFTCEIDTGGGYAFIDIQEFELTIDNNPAADRYKLGQTSRKGIGRGGHRSVSGKLTKEYDSLAERNLYRNLTFCGLRFKWDDGFGKTLTITVPLASFTGGDPKADTEGVLNLPMEFEAYSLGANAEIQMVLTNSVSAIP